MFLGILIMATIFFGQLLIYLFYKNSIKNVDDYFLGNRSLGLFFSIFGIWNVWFGTEACMGAAASAFHHGLLGARIEPLGYSLCLILAGLFLAKQIRSRNFQTLADFYRERYSAKVEKTAVWVMIPSTLIWVGAQIGACGHIIQTITNQSFYFCLFVVFIFVCFQSAFGSIIGNIINSTIHGLFLIFGLIFILFISIKRLDFSANMLIELKNLNLNLYDSNSSFWENLDVWLIPILGSFTSHEIVARFNTAKSPKIAKKATLYAGFLYLLIGLIPVTLGIISLNILPELNDQYIGDNLLPLIAKKLLPSPFFYLLMGTMISALILSIEASLITVSSLCHHNLLKFYTKNLSERKKLVVARIFFALAGIFSFLICLREEDIMDLIKLASSTGTAGLFIITILGLWLKNGHALSAQITLIFGLIITPVAENIELIKAPYLFSLTSCLICFTLFNLINERKLKAFFTFDLNWTAQRIKLTQKE